MSKSLVIVGGGAAGFFAAINAKIASRSQGYSIRSHCSQLRLRYRAGTL